MRFNLIPKLTHFEFLFLKFIDLTNFLKMQSVYFFKKCLVTCIQNVNNIAVKKIIRLVFLFKNIYILIYTAKDIKYRLNMIKSEIVFLSWLSVPMYLVLILSSKNNKTCKMEKETNDKRNDKSSILFQLSPKRIVVNVMRRKGTLNQLFNEKRTWYRTLW